MAPMVPPLSPDTSESGIRRALTDFQAAYSALDVQGVKRVWPAVDVAALTRLFGALQFQELDLARCEIFMSASPAQAVCHASARMIPKDKAQPPRFESRQWTFEMERGEREGWAVRSIDIQ
jgi:hypothetical protein